MALKMQLVLLCWDEFKEVKLKTVEVHGTLELTSLAARDAAISHLLLIFILIDNNDLSQQAKHKIFSICKIFLFFLI